MAAIRQCDRCQRMDKSFGDYAVITLDDDRHWDICPGCQKDFDVFIKNMSVTGRVFHAAQ